MEAAGLANKNLSARQRHYLEDRLEPEGRGFVGLLPYQRICRFALPIFNCVVAVHLCCPFPNLVLIVTPEWRSRLSPGLRMLCNTRFSTE